MFSLLHCPEGAGLRREEIAVNSRNTRWEVFGAGPTKYMINSINLAVKIAQGHSEIPQG